MELKDHYIKQITNWVAKMYGQNEAYNPSWDIESLAEMLASDFFAYKQGYEMDNILDEVKQIANAHNIELSDDLAETIAKDYYYSEAYGMVDDNYILDEIAYRKGEQ